MPAEETDSPNDLIQSNKSLRMNTDAQPLPSLIDNPNDSFFLRSLAANDAPGLASVGDAGATEFLTKAPRTWHESSVREFVLHLLQTPSSQFYAIIDRCSAQPLGMTAFLDISYYHRRLEIGWTWLAAAQRGTGLNGHVKRRLLQTAFERGFLRVTLTTDTRNIRSQRAIEKLGATKEGVLRQYGRMPNDYQRDVIVYSILKDDFNPCSVRKTDPGSLFSGTNYDRAFAHPYARAYGLLQHSLLTAAYLTREALRVADYGCGDGWGARQLSLYEGVYLGLDSNETAISDFYNRWNNTSPLRSRAVLHAGTTDLANDEVYLNQWPSLSDRPPNLMLCNAVGHEINRAGQNALCLFTSFLHCISPGGTILIGDYWYPPSLSQYDIDSSRKWIRDNTGHEPAPPGDFISPIAIADAIRRASATAPVSVQRVSIVAASVRPDLALEYYLLRINIAAL